MTEFDKLKETFLMLGFNIENYKVNDLYYKCEGNIEKDKLILYGYHDLWFELFLNEDKSIKLLEISSKP